MRWDFSLVQFAFFVCFLYFSTYYTFIFLDNTNQKSESDFHARVKKNNFFFFFSFKAELFAALCSVCSPTEHLSEVCFAGCLFLKEETVRKWQVKAHKWEQQAEYSEISRHVWHWHPLTRLSSACRISDVFVLRLGNTYKHCWQFVKNNPKSAPFLGQNQL